MIFKIPVSWEVSADIEIEADTLEQAIKLAEDDDIPLPQDWDYVDASWTVNKEMAEFINKEENEN